MLNQCWRLAAYRERFLELAAIMARHHGSGLGFLGSFLTHFLIPRERRNVHSFFWASVHLVVLVGREILTHH